MATTTATDSGKTSTSAPIVVDLGKRTAKQIKKLTEGRGKLLAEVDDVLQELKVAGKISGHAVPVIVVVKKKPRTALLPWMS